MYHGFGKDARLSLEALAGLVGLSAPAVQRRIKRLRDAGVISGEVILVDPAAVGMAMTFVISVELERERADQVDSFRRKAQDEPLVQQCYYVTGECDFMLIVIAKNMDEFAALSRRMFFDDQNIRRFRTLVVMGKPYKSLAVPV